MSDLPPAWKWATLGELAQRVRGVTFRKAESVGAPAPGHLPVIRAGNIQDGRLDLSSDLVWVPNERIAAEQVLRGGDIVVATSSGSLSVVGKSARVTRDWEGAHGAFLTAIRPLRGVESRFLAYWLQSDAVRNAWSASAAGTNINNLKASTLVETRVPLAPREEQDRIVAAIEEHLSRLDAAEGTVRSGTERLAMLTSSVMRRLLRQDDERWQEVGVREVAQLSLGKMLDSKQQTGDYPTTYLRNVNVRWGVFDLGELATMDVRPGERDRCMVKRGDLVMCEGGEPGRCAVWNAAEPVAIQKALHRIRPSPAASSEFLALVFRSLAESGRLSKYFTGTTIKHLPKERLGEVRLRLPPVDVQTAAVAEADDYLSGMVRLRGACDGLGMRSRGLRTSILAAAFSGQLVPQDPHDEPASVFLERVRVERAAGPAQQRRKAATT